MSLLTHVLIVQWSMLQFFPGVRYTHAILALMCMWYCKSEGTIVHFVVIFVKVHKLSVIVHAVFIMVQALFVTVF